MPADRSQQAEQEDGINILCGYRRIDSQKTVMWIKTSMLELITAQQHLCSHVCVNAVITSIAFGFIVLTKRHGKMKQASRPSSFS